MTQRLPIGAAAFVAAIFGFSFLFTKSVLFYLHPFQLLGLRFALAAVSISLLAVLGIIKVRIPRAGLAGLLKVAVWQPVLYFTFETYGVKLTSASETGVIIALIPVAVAVLSYFMLGERLTWAQAFSIFAAAAGVMIMAVAGSGRSASPAEHILGILCLFGAVMAASLYNIFSRQASLSHSPLNITFVMMWLGAVVFNIIGAAYSVLTGTLGTYVKALQQPPVVFGLLYLGVLSSVIAFFFLNYSLSKLTASRVAVFLNLVPLVTVTAGMVFLSEKLGPWQIMGCCLILFGVWGTNYFIGRRRELFCYREQEKS